MQCTVSLHINVIHVSMTFCPCYVCAEVLHFQTNLYLDIMEFFPVYTLHH